MNNPYDTLAEEAFWKTAVAVKNPFDICKLWKPKWKIKQSYKVSTFGSCFAQHIGKALAARDYNWLRTEIAPSNLASQKDYNYNVFTSRTGNIYTTSLLKQWVDWAIGDATPPLEFWEKNSRYYDPFRPRVEPNGFESVSEMLRSREVTIESFREAIETSDIFVFTLGLTESWFNAKDGYEYPMCPGTVGGVFDSELHEFVNQDYSFVKKNLLSAMRKIRSVNPKIKFLLTVSPVPLTATNSGNHVLTATSHSKAVLRAVAGELSSAAGPVDYFPSYEIINTAPFRGMFFEPNQRSVNHRGVSFVMDSFFACQQSAFGTNMDNVLPIISASSGDALVCEEELLDAFASGQA